MGAYMLKHTMLLFGICLCCSSSFVSAKDVNSADYLANYVLDWETARTDFANCRTEKKHKSHFMLGECPKMNSIHLYYATSALLHFTAVTLLPEKYAEHLRNTELKVNFSYSEEVSQIGVKYQF